MSASAPTASNAALLRELGPVAARDFAETMRSPAGDYHREPRLLQRELVFAATDNRPGGEQIVKRGETVDSAGTLVKGEMRYMSFEACMDFMTKTA